MKHLISLIFAGVIIINCALMGHSKENTDVQKIKATKLGIYLIETGKGLEVLGAKPGYPAAKCGLETGDIVKSINDKPFEAYGQFKSFENKINISQKINLVVERAGSLKILKTYPKEIEVPDDFDSRPEVKLEELLPNNNSLNLMIVIGEMNDLSIPDAEVNKDWNSEWTNSLKAKLETAAEDYLKPLTVYPNFNIIGRRETDEVLKDVKVSLRAVFSEEFKAKAVQATGATHVLYVKFEKWPDSKGNFVSNTEYKLINLETEEISGEQKITVKEKSNGK